MLIIRLLTSWGSPLPWNNVRAVKRMRKECQDVSKVKEQVPEEWRLMGSQVRTCGWRARACCVHTHAGVRTEMFQSNTQEDVDLDCRCRGEAKQL